MAELLRPAKVVRFWGVPEIALKIAGIF